MNTEIERMLPEYVNGRLPKEDIKRIEEMMEQDINIKTEIEFLRSLQKAVKNEEVESPADWGWARLKRSLPEVDEAVDSNASSWWKPLAVAASFAFILQTSYMLFNETKIDDGYVPLSTSEFENTIQLVFSENINQSEITDLLLSLEADIVSGPSASGVYRITTKDPDKAIAILKDSNLIEYADLE